MSGQPVSSQRVASPDAEAGDAETRTLSAAAMAMARRFAAGGTMWCVAPSWPDHGSHVAVEFVHPVIVGKRALPAVQIAAPDWVGRLRLLARPGDILMILAGAATDAGVASLPARAGVWGLTTVWIGAGPRRDDLRADHVIWVDETSLDVAARNGELVLRYHLLWELTHVVFEHPGLLGETPACDEEVCITCSDEGRVVEVRSVAGPRAEVLAAGSIETVDVSLVAAPAPGDLLLVHAGVALDRLEVSTR